MTNEELLKKAKFWSGILGRFPGVRAIFLSGSVAQGKTKKTSDIDFFIIARKGQIWTARFFVFVGLKLCGQMRSDTSHAGQICPNHFITDSNLEIQEKDAYSANLFSHAIPLYDPDFLNTFFVQENKDWVRDFGESFQHISNPGIEVSLIPGLNYKQLNFFWHWLEKKLKSLQMRKIKANPAYHIPGAKIVLSDTELRFHPKPKNKIFTHR